MKIIQIKINEYKILKNNSFKLNGKQLFPKGAQILGLIGPNGSGKTTLCSMISWIFQSISTRTDLDFDIHIKFEFNNDLREIIYKDNTFELLINCELYYKFKSGSRLNKKDKEIHNDKINVFWNGKILLSTFETNGEYPNEKPYNYIGDDHLTKYDLAGLYGKNSYSYPSITNGIIRFLKNSSKQNIANIFLEQMGFQLSGYIDLKIVRNIADIIYEPSLSDEDKFWLTKECINSRHYTPEKVREAKKKEKEVTLYNKLLNDSRLRLDSDSQSLSFSDVLNISNEYSEYMGKYIFLNGLGLIKDDVNLSFEELSSGEKFLIIRYISILSGLEKDSIVIIEEPENHLNPKWRELVIPALHKATTEFNSTLIFTTHDYRIIRYLHNNCVLKISKGVINKVAEPTLLCDEFDFESIGEKTLPFVYKELKETYYTMEKKEKAELLNAMCNVEEKIFLRKQFLENYENN
ncbi:MAG: AAA family ATPase [Candidatus Gracilibacteria bacterium]|nr:AAA family ATPase [Candidatus Gracilibacteria bacterium]